jgi:hypothetical protein
MNLDEEGQEIANAILTWIKAARAGYHRPDWLPTMADVSHSALLGRILAGGKPLPYAPPIAFSYPWYDLYDEPTEDHFVVEVHIRNQFEIVINQVVWKAHEEKKDLHYTVMYGDNPDVFDLKLKPYIRKVFQKSTRTIVEVPSEGWFIKKR